MRDFDLFDRLRARTALLAIGPSALRNQGAGGVVDVAHKYLRSMDLRKFSVTTQAEFSDVLHKRTRYLRGLFPRGAKNWGTARKALNIFLRDVVYSRLLCKHYGLSPLERWLELPLDRDVHQGLKRHSLGKIRKIPWPGVKSLKPRVSKELQTVAEAIARSQKVRRVHLDVKYWRKREIDKLKG